MNQKEFEERIVQWIEKVNSVSGFSSGETAFSTLDQLMHEIPQWGDESVVPVGSELLQIYRGGVYWLYAMSADRREHTFVLTSGTRDTYARVALPTSVVETGLAEYFKQRQEKPRPKQGKPMSKVKLGFKKLDPDAQLPKYAHEGDAGMDVFALEDSYLDYGTPRIVRTGLAAEIPDGYELQVRPRSGLALKGVTVWNSPGTIDSKYRGEIGVILVFVNHGSNEIANENGRVYAISRTPVDGYKIKKGDKIAQLVLAPVTFAEPYEVQELSETDRGTGGFGSTGR